MQRCVSVAAERRGNRKRKARASDKKGTRSGGRMDALSSLPRVCGHEICSARCAAGALYSLSACAGDVRRHGVFAVHDHGERLTVVGLLEGRLTAHQHVEDDAQAPDVCGDGDKARTSEFGKMQGNKKGRSTRRRKGSVGVWAEKCPFRLLTYILCGRGGRNASAGAPAVQLEHRSHSITVSKYALTRDTSVRPGDEALPRCLPPASCTHMHTCTQALTHTHTHT